MGKLTIVASMPYTRNGKRVRAVVVIEREARCFDEFKASNGVSIVSHSVPDYYSSIPALYVRGATAAYDGLAVFVPDEQWADVRKAVAEFGGIVDGDAYCDPTKPKNCGDESATCKAIRDGVALSEGRVKQAEPVPKPEAQVKDADPRLAALVGKRIEWLHDNKGEYGVVVWVEPAGWVAVRPNPGQEERLKGQTRPDGTVWFHRYCFFSNMPRARVMNDAECAIMAAKVALGHKQAPTRKCGFAVPSWRVSVKVGEMNVSIYGRKVELGATARIERETMGEAMEACGVALRRAGTEWPVCPESGKAVQVSYALSEDRRRMEGGFVCLACAGRKESK